MITRREEERKGDGGRWGGRERFRGLRASKWWKRREWAGSEGEVRRGTTGRGGDGPREREGDTQVSSSLPSHAGHPATPRPTSALALPLPGGGRRPAPGGLYRHPPPRPPARTGPRLGSRRRSEGSGGGGRRRRQHTRP
jgi:hypothetical protein